MVNETYRQWFDIILTAFRFQAQRGELMPSSADIREAALAAVECCGGDEEKIDAAMAAINPVWPI